MAIHLSGQPQCRAVYVRRPGGWVLACLPLPTITAWLRDGCDRWRGSERRGAGSERVQGSGDRRGFGAQCVGIVLCGETPHPLGNGRQIGRRPSGLKDRVRTSSQRGPSGSLSLCCPLNVGIGGRHPCLSSRRQRGEVRHRRVQATLPGRRALWRVLAVLREARLHRTINDPPIVGGRVGCPLDGVLRAADLLRERALRSPPCHASVPRPAGIRIAVALQCLGVEVTADSVRAGEHRRRL
jgi:hypothetical protein